MQINLRKRYCKLKTWKKAKDLINTIEFILEENFNG